MSRKTELEQWIKAANAYSPEVPGLGKLSLPILVQVDEHEVNRKYKVTGMPIKVPTHGEMLDTGRTVMYRGVAVDAPMPSAGDDWSKLKERVNRDGLTWVLKDLKINGVAYEADTTSEAIEAVEPAKAPISEEIVEEEQPTPASDETTEDGNGLVEDVNTESDQKVESTETVETPDFDSMKKADVIKWAEDNGIEVDAKASKASIVKSLS